MPPPWPRYRSAQDPMSEEQKANGPTEAGVPLEVAIDFIKSNLFRVIHVDGVWGGVTSSAAVHMAMYSERPALPQRIVHKVGSDFTLGDEVPEKRITRDAVLIREVEAEVVMSVDTARALHLWLGDKLDLIDGAFKAMGFAGDRND